MELWHGWVVLGVGLLVWEIFTPGFVLAAFALGCLAAASVAYKDWGLTAQLVAFSVASFIGFAFIRPFFIKFIYRFSDARPTGVDALIGRTGLVEEKIDNRRGTGRVKLGGELWKAAAADDSTIEPGVLVRVDRVEGATVFVSTAEE